MDIVYLLIFNCSPHKKEEEKPHLNGQGIKGNISDESHYRISEVGSAFHFLIILTTHASNKPTKVSTCQMGDSF